MANIIQTFPAGSGGGSGTSNYNDLTNKPQIEGIELKGNKLLSQFGLTDQVETQSNLSIDRNIKSYVNRGEKYDWNTASTWYGTCSTSASTTAKSPTFTRGAINFVAGAKIAVKFTYNNTASAPTLTINNTTKNIKYIDADGNVTTPLVWWNAGDVVEFIYDGTQWLMQPTMQMLFAGQGTRIPRESIYSTSEKVVGCWTDGRPIYQKVIAVTIPTTTSDGTMKETTYSIGASVLKFIEIYGITTMANNNADAMIVYKSPLGNSNGIDVFGCPNTYTTSSERNTIKIRNSYVNYGGSLGYVVAKYTKTTDSANSFNYGDPNDYSTTEKIVGTWVDGKPLYQKTINFGALPNATTKSVNHNISNISKIVLFKGWFANSDNSAWAYIPYASGIENNTVEAWATPSQITVRTFKDQSGFTTCYITINYTKTTD